MPFAAHVWANVSNGVWQAAVSTWTSETNVEKKKQMWLCVASFAQKDAFVQPETEAKGELSDGRSASGPPNHKGHLTHLGTISAIAKPTAPCCN